MDRLIIQRGGLDLRFVDQIRAFGLPGRLVWTSQGTLGVSSIFCQFPLMAVVATGSKMPSIDLLGRDPLTLTPVQRLWSILRPAICVAGYFVCAVQGWWIPAVFAVAGLMFITYVSTSHDLLHRTLGFPRWLNECLLSGVEMLALRSGHAFRISHLSHHRHFPDVEDIEGQAAKMPLWRALLEGVGQQTRLFVWAWPRARKTEKIWMAGEALWVVSFVTASVVLWPHTPVFAVYVGLVVSSSWLYPVATVWIPHRAEAKEVLFQTHAVRGRVVPELVGAIVFAVGWMLMRRSEGTQAKSTVRRAVDLVKV